MPPTPRRQSPRLTAQAAAVATTGALGVCQARGGYSANVSLSPLSGPSPAPSNCFGAPSPFLAPLPRCFVTVRPPFFATSFFHLRLAQPVLPFSLRLLCLRHSSRRLPALSLCCLTAAHTRDLRSRLLWLMCLRGSPLPLSGPARPLARLCSTSTSRGSPSLFARLSLVASATSGDEGMVTSSSSSSRRHGRSPRCTT